MNKIENFISKDRVMLKFLFLFFFFAVILYNIILFYEFMHQGFLRECMAHIVGVLLNLFGILAYVDGSTITVPNFTIEVIYECIGMWSIIVYSSFILAYPTDLKKKFIGIAFGIPSLFSIAVFRIFCLAVIGMSYPDIWNYFHVYFWQLSLIIFVILLLLIWLEKVVKLKHE